jgi:hypothetical protein
LAGKSDASTLTVCPSTRSVEGETTTAGAMWAAAGAEMSAAMTPSNADYEQRAHHTERRAMDAMAEPPISVILPLNANTRPGVDRR